MWYDNKYDIKRHLLRFHEWIVGMINETKLHVLCECRTNKHTQQKQTKYNSQIKFDYFQFQHRVVDFSFHFTLCLNSSFYFSFLFLFFWVRSLVRSEVRTLFSPIVCEMWVYAHYYYYNYLCGVTHHNFVIWTILFE